MEIINGLLVKQNNVDFLLTQKAFATAEKKYPQYSMLIEYLKFRFFDAYDLLNFINNYLVNHFQIIQLYYYSSCYSFFL